VFAGLGFAIALAAGCKSAKSGEAVKSEIRFRIHEAEERGQARPAKDSMQRYFNGAAEVSGVILAASSADMDFYILSTSQVREGYDYLVLSELIRRGDKSRITALLTKVDWGPPGWGDFFTQDMEWELASGFPSQIPFEGVDLLMDVAGAAMPEEIQKNLILRVKFTLGVSGLADVPDGDVVRVGRSWLAQNRERVELNNRYPPFMDSGGAPFGSPHAVYLLRLKGEPITPLSEPVPTVDRN
jgi:hypothetical protein